jgi:hypothetical protein
MEFLRDPIWQFVGAVIGVAAIIASLFIFLRQRAIKSLGFEIVTQTELLSIRNEIKSKVKVTYEGKAVQAVNLVTIRVANDGNTPIPASNYERPLSFSFNETTTILSADITEVSPKSLSPSLKVEGSTIVLKPTLLNPGDDIQISLLLAGHDGEIETDARIEGIREVKNEIRLSLKPVTRARIMLGTLVLLTAVLMYAFWEESRLFILIGVVVFLSVGVDILNNYQNQEVIEIRRRNRR